jgi:hypothetical protein
MKKKHIYMLSMLLTVLIAIRCKEKQQFSNESVTSLKSVTSNPQQIKFSISPFF